MAALLEVAVLEPVCVVTAHVGPPAQSLEARRLNAHGPLVRGHHVVPEAHCHEDVRRHVLGVAGGGRDLGVGSRRGQAQGRMDGIVEGVDRVVDGPRMVGVPLQDRLRYGRGPHVRG